MSDAQPQVPAGAVAVIGMAGRFPGARSVDQFWQNLVQGVETISRFREEELEVSVATAEARVRGQKFVAARAVLDDVDLFDAAFFGIHRREAELMDPQHRLFLECSWEAIEAAGYDPGRYPGMIGVFAGASLNTYLLHNLGTGSELARNYQVGLYQTMLGNDKDFLPTRVAYKLDLKGPAISVQCACSTSLVAVCQACQALLTYQCDMALAGGVSITFPQKRDYPALEGGMVSEDGTCRSFDANANGTVFGHGVAVVLLKRLEDALADGDHVLAVIRGFAVNNDGALKVSFAAPSLQGQAEVIATAHAIAGVDPETITYLEAHGTGTTLGDPIEIAAATRAFRTRTNANGFCALGTGKTHIGHLDVAAGVTGLIKTILQIQHGLIPPLLHFQAPNPKIDFQNSPFFPVTKLMEWKRTSAPRRAGVSSFGVGGTNAHVVLEEAPPREPSGPSRPAQLLVLSARTAGALEKATRNLTAWLRDHFGQAGCLPLRKGEGGRDARPTFADVAFTLQTGRKVFEHRRIVVARAADEAVEALEKNDARRVFTQAQRPSQPRVAFLFPGQGAQYVQMGRELYATERVFREHVDECAAVLQPGLQVDLRELLYPAAGQEDNARFRLTQTSLTQPALFVIEYALARLWQSWGIQPAAMVGHSLGEYVAAVLAGVMTLEDGLKLLAARARLMQSMPEGGMLSVRLPEADVRPLLRDSLAVAVVNSPRHCVVSGSHDDLAGLKRALESRGVACKPLHTSHAFHSPMMEPVLEPFTEHVRKVKLNPTRIPIVSTLTGQWIEPEEWTDPAYWGRQLRHTVRFGDAVGELVKRPDFILLEVGPGQTLSQLAQQHPGRAKDQLVQPSMPPIENPDETVALLTALGRLWLAGVEVDWTGFYRDERRHRTPLPTYPFERERYWIEPPKSGASVNTGPLAASVSEQKAGRPVPLLNAPPGTAGGQPDAPTGASSPVSNASIEQVIAEQLRLMALQLQALKSRSE